MNGWQQALSKASSVTHWTVGMCDNFVANMYGFAASGFNTAADNWNGTPSNMKHPGDFNAPAGALMFWGGGAGHVAIADGQGGIFSTDISGDGTVSHVPSNAITQKWGKPYLGWSYPYFQGQTGTVGAATGASVQNASSSLGPSALDFLTSQFGTDAKDLAERLGLILMGGLLVLVGLSIGTGKKILIGGKSNAKEGREKAVSDSEETGVREGKD